MDLHSGTDLQLTIGEALDTEDYLTRTRAFVDSEVLPMINDYWERTLAG